MEIAVFEDDQEYAAKLEAIIRRHTHHPTAINTPGLEDMMAFVKQAPGAGLYILDIVKEGRTEGFEIAEQVTGLENGSLVVFLTNYPQKIMYNAFFKTKAFNCIHKNNPYLQQEICDTIQLAQQALSGTCLLIHTGRFETLYIPYDNICFIETIKGSDKLCVHAKSGQYIIRGTLKNIAQQLAPHGFAYCRRTILLNTGQEMRVDTANKSVVFPNGASCPYSMKRWMK